MEMALRDAHLNEELLDFLQRNAGQAWTCPELAKRFNTTVRNIQQAIQDCRTERGAPICSGDRGIWFATVREEAEEYIERHKSRAITLMTTMSEMKKSVDFWFPPDPEPDPEQRSLFDLLEEVPA